MSQAALVIAVDGPSGVGKTTVSRELARRLDLRYVDTGAMYRAVAVKADEEGVDIDDAALLKEFLAGLKIVFDSAEAKIYVDGEDLSVKIRTPEAGMLASRSSAKDEVRSFLVDLQRGMAQVDGGVVMEGRDIGTVVLQGADIKFFLTASHEVRAARRHLEFKSTPSVGEAQMEKVSEDIAERDLRDSTRKNSPLKAAADAVVIDTGELDIEGVISKMLGVVTERAGA